MSKKQLIAPSTLKKGEIYVAEATGIQPIIFNGIIKGLSLEVFVPNEKWRGNLDFYLDTPENKVRVSKLLSSLGLKEVKDLLEYEFQIIATNKRKQNDKGEWVDDTREGTGKIELYVPRFRD